MSTGYERIQDRKNAALQAASLIVAHNLSTLVELNLSNGVQGKSKVAKAVADLAHHIQKEMEAR